MVQRDNGEKVFALTPVITLVDVPKIDTSSHRRLNNFVTEVLSRDLAAQAGAQQFTFDNPKNGWVFIAVQSAGVAASGRRRRKVGHHAATIAPRRSGFSR